MPMIPERLLPPVLRPHCKSLSLVDNCPDIGSMGRDYRRLRYTDDRLLCGVMDGQVLKTVLLAMPRLRSILVHFLSNELENFGLQLFNFSPRPRLATNVDTLSFAPLKSFQYIQPAFRWIPHHFPPERDALADHVCMLSVDPWPRLRELVLQGQLPENIRSPFITLLSGMPKLRVLSLMFALPRDVDPQPVWPRGLDTSFPWPELESLVLSFPTPDDQLYASLPPCLRRLSLRCCPHHCVHEWVDRPEWRSPVLSASEMLRVLSRCRLPHLERLQFEYRADDADGSLLRHLTAAFPQLLTLEIHRFRPVGVDEIPMVAIGEEIRSLSRLHTLSIHLDSPDHPTPGLQLLRTGLVLRLSYAQMKASARMLRSHADLLAPLLSRSVRLLRLVQRDDYHGTWQAYRVSRADDNDDVVHVKYDPACSTEVLSPDWFVKLLGPD
ncbi:hypothetical protein LXA43DRAFT_1093948 [Ganoderma leucocontextum]|nr:hypothetical protein LXA43DRAFT_1093948 [Ganoderma leucocontextum]